MICVYVTNVVLDDAVAVRYGGGEGWTGQTGRVPVCVRERGRVCVCVCVFFFLIMFVFVRVFVHMRR